MFQQFIFSYLMWETGGFKGFSNQISLHYSKTKIFGHIKCDVIGTLLKSLALLAALARSSHLLITLLRPLIVSLSNT